MPDSTLKFHAGCKGFIVNENTLKGENHGEIS